MLRIRSGSVTIFGVFPDVDAIAATLADQTLESVGRPAGAVATTRIEDYVVEGLRVTAVIADVMWDEPESEQGEVG